MTHTNLYSRIIGTGSCLPPMRVTNEELASQLATRGIETSDEWIFTRTGIRARHFVNAEQNTSDLALTASQQALEAAGVDPQTVDLILVATSTPDCIFPSTACLLQNKLGIRNNCAAFDVQAVCSGFAYALTVADQFIRSGTYRTVLVVGQKLFRAYWILMTVQRVCSLAMVLAPLFCALLKSQVFWPARSMQMAVMRIFSVCQVG